MLYIWMPEAEEMWCWSKGDTWQAVSSLDQLIQQLETEQLTGKSNAKNNDAVIFFPTQKAQILSQHMSKAQYKQLGADGIKYLLEDDIALPIDQMLVRNSFNAPDQIHLMGVAQYHVETWRNALSLLPIQVVAILPDFLVLPSPVLPKQVILGCIHGRMLARHGAIQGQGVDDLALYLQFQAADVDFLTTGLNTVQQAQLQQHTGQTTQKFDYHFDGLGLTKQHPFNVLPKAQNRQVLSGYWLACAALVLALIVVQLSYDLLRYSKLKSLADQTSMQAISQYKSWFGTNNRVTEQNIKSQFQSQLQSSKSANNQALDLLSRVGPILMQNKIVAQELRSDTSSLSIVLKGNSSEQLQTLAQQLNKQGFKAQLGNVRADAGAAIGLLRVE